MKTALELSAKYGKPWENQAAFEREHMTLWRADDWERKYRQGWNTPWMKKNAALSIESETEYLKFIHSAPFSRIYCNRAIIEKLDLTFLMLAHQGCLSEIQTFDGCFNVRKIRGKEADPDAYSIHSFGLALDFNAHLMPLGAPSVWTDKFVTIWTAMGWTWGGNFERKDGMHFECTDL